LKIVVAAGVAVEIRPLTTMTSSHFTNLTVPIRNYLSWDYVAVPMMVLAPGAGIMPKSIVKY